VFLAAIVLTGIGYSLLFSAGVGVAAELAPAGHRAATVSAVYFFGYAAQAVAAIGLGQLATAEGLFRAIALGAVLLSLLAVVAGAAPFVRARRALRSIAEGNPA
jgi:MFS family permease